LQQKEVNMLSSDGAWARFIFSLCFFLLSGSEMITGWLATLSGVAGTIELATALMRYSPLQDLIQVLISQHAKQSGPTR
jgi:hypothetical protein